MNGRYLEEKLDMDEKSIMLLSNNQYRTVTVESVDRIAGSLVKMALVICSFGFMVWISYFLNSIQITFLCALAILSALMAWLIYWLNR